MKRYVYFFVLGNKIVHSYETADSLRARVTLEEDKQVVEELITSNHSGNFLPLSTGEMILHE